MNARTPANPRNAEEWALRLIGEGFRIFPLQPRSKEPYRGEGWKAIVTRDPSRVREWFRNRPDMNYGVVCEKDRVIIDVDNGLDKHGRLHEGEAHFHEAEDEDRDWSNEPSAFDSTFKVKTPRGGYHLYFSCERPYQISVSKIIPDVDVRTCDGYVVGPGCVTDDIPDKNTVAGEYVVVNDKPIAHVPPWLEARLDAAGLTQERAANANAEVVPLDLPENIALAEALLAQREPAIQGQHGDHHTYVTACMVKDYGISEDKCVELMFGEWNDRCEPEWDFDGLREKVYNAYHYGNRPVGAKADALGAFGTRDEEPLASAVESEFAVGSAGQGGGEDIQTERIRSQIFTGPDFLTRKFEVESLIPEWVPAFGITAILARRGVGKSVLMVDMALRVATDQPWNGTPITQGWASVYLCGEDDIGLQRQMTAWKVASGTFPDRDRLIVASAVPDLMNAGDVRLWAMELKSRLNGRRAVVFLDTWQRATSRASQNEDKEMQTAVHNAEALARALNGCAVIAFHSPKGSEETITGSLVQENSTVSILIVTNTKDGGGTKNVKVARIKGRGEGNSANFHLREIYLGKRDDSGQELTGVVPQFSSDGMNAAQRAIAKAQEKDARRRPYAEIVRKIIEKNGGPLTVNQVVLRAEGLKASSQDFVFPKKSTASDDLVNLFLGDPFTFERGEKLELREVNSHKREFHLLLPENSEWEISDFENLPNRRERKPETPEVAGKILN